MVNEIRGLQLGRYEEILDEDERWRQYWLRFPKTNVVTALKKHRHNKSERGVSHVYGYGDLMSNERLDWRQEGWKKHILLCMLTGSVKLPFGGDQSCRSKG